mgnify:CR=1 FL=1
MTARADLHLHSRHSARSAEWLLRRFDVPDSCSEPRALYDRLRARGMDFVTLTDHNEIGGCLEIADLPGVFLSEEVTAYFPEDRAKIHILVWGITEAQHREIGGARQNLFDLQRLLAEQGIAHAVAHPLYRLDSLFSTSHLEQLILLFRHFEVVNGLRHHQLGDTLRFALERLTPDPYARSEPAEWRADTAKASCLVCLLVWSGPLSRAVWSSGSVPRARGAASGRLVGRRSQMGCGKCP